MIRVVQFVRRPPKGAFSIERVDKDVRRCLPSSVSVTVIENRFLSRGLLPRLRDAWRARRYAGRVNHVTGDIHYVTFFLRKARTILTIHDTLMVERASGLRRVLLWFFWIWLPVRRCGTIVAISEESKRRILEFVKCDPTKIVVIHNPVSVEFRQDVYPEVLSVFKLLHIGTKDNKNLRRVIEAVSGLRLELTIVGRLRDEDLEALGRFDVKFRNCYELSDSELQALYRQTHALIFVSISEGFGLPILEAQATGRPVITSARAPMDEVAGAGALLVNPEDVVAIRVACMRVMADSVLRSELIAAGAANVKRYEALAVSRSYASLYARVAGSLV